MENKLDKPYKVKDNLIFENSVIQELDKLSCRNGLEGVCYFNESFGKCVERNTDIATYFKVGKDSICLPFDSKNELNPIEGLKNSSIFKELNNVSIKTIVKDKYEFPPNASNVVFYNDILTIQNIETGFTIGKAMYPVKDKAEISFDEKIDVNILPISQSVEYSLKGEFPIKYGDNIAFAVFNSALTMSLCFLSASITNLTCCWCSSWVLENITISSIYTIQKIPMYGAKISFITLWNVAGPLASPKGITLNWNSPLCVAIAVFSTQSGSIPICQYPDARSIVENHSDPCSESKMSCINGKG